MRAVVAFALAAALAGGGPPPAHARPGDAVVMTAAGGRQEGTFVFFTATGGDRRSCWVLHGDGPNRQPAAVAHDGSPLRWRLADKRKPVRVTVHVSRLRVDGTPVATAPESLAPTLTPVKTRNRVVAWTVTTPEVGYGDLDVTLHVAWKGVCGTDETAQRFHARSLPV